jgi:hypothetical protein
MSYERDSFILKKCNLCYLYQSKDNFYKGNNRCKGCYIKLKKCEHNKIKSTCRDCEGGSICKHNKIKSICRECGGRQICEHNKQRSQCKECRGASICEHSKIRSQCKECRGSQICEHNKQRSICKECKGGCICEHNKIRSICKECKGGSICEHNKIKSICRECRGSQICEHNKERSTCRECKGRSICKHNKRKSDCIICNPNCSCTECKSVYVKKTSLCYPLCQACFCNKYPDHKNSTLYKIKERYLRDELRERFKEHSIDMIFDKSVDGGCSKKRPDVLIDCLTHSIVIECDEYQHINYECENKRTMQLFKDLGNRPLVLIRFNPDTYVDENEEKVQGCFIPLTKVEDIHKKRFYNINEKEWVRRLNILEQKIKEYLSLDTFPNKEITEIKLFYSH